MGQAAIYSKVIADARIAAMTSSASGAMLASVVETEPNRIWFGRGGCVEQHDDGR